MDSEDTVADAPAAGGSAPALRSQRYVIGELIGRGGMGEVLSARDTELGRDVAVKRMRRQDPSDRAIERFLREARVQARLDHPAIVPVYEVGRDAAGLPYFVMKKLAGTTLAEILTGTAGGYTRERLLRAFADWCLAVELAHTRGVIHRDLKPDNLVVGDFGEVYVLDWGVAKVIGEADGDFADVVATGSETGAGTVIGTPAYMSPEQALGAADIDAATDVYALGCVLFAILAGEPMHRDPERSPATRAPDRDVPPELDALCVRATDPDRAARVTSARALGDGVQRYLDGDRDLSLRRELARDHLARAEAAFTAGDSDVERRVAMREAGRALALDPALPGPAELVGRLMLEPPRTTPREVDEAIAADAAANGRSQARTSMWMNVAYLGFTPFLFDYDGTNNYALLFVAVIGVNMALIWARTKPSSGSINNAPVGVALRNAFMVAIVAFLFSPLLFAPALAVVNTTSLLMGPLYPRPRAVAMLVLCMIAAVLLPWGLELVGLKASSITIHDGAIDLHPLTLAGRQYLWTGLVFYVVAIVVVSTPIVFNVRRKERESKRLLHVQAWHLRQLVRA